MTAFFSEALGKYDRSAFTSGNERIDNYFRQTISQDVKRSYAAGFVLVDKASAKIAGFYTLSSHSIPLTDLPVEVIRKLPRYPSIPAVLIGWLGRDAGFRGQHIGPMLLADAITRPGLEKTLRIIIAALRGQFGIAEPRVLVSGLNPHCGEGGHLGREEIEVITPVLERLRAQGLNVEGPIPADTLFVPSRLKGADCVLAMYHDQGLPVLKYASFGGGVNITLGLPFIRTSVDHGTALDLAGHGGADPGSLHAAVAMARDMVMSMRGRAA